VERNISEVEEMSVSKFVLRKQALTINDSSIISNSYLFRDSLSINFSLSAEADSLSSISIDGNKFHKKLNEIFYSSKMAKKIGKNFFLRHFNLDSTYINTNTGELSLDKIYKISYSEKKYLLFIFHKNNFDIMPFEKDICYLFNIKNLEVIGFLSVNPPDLIKSKPNFFLKKNRLHLKCLYWASRDILKSFDVYENENNKWNISK
jgi:hypothetical protein